MAENGSLFVLVTVGTDHHAFDRLIRWIDGWLEERGRSGIRCLVQTGTSRVPRLAGYRAYLSYHELEAATVEADVLVCHAGSGTVQMCRRLGRKPILVPRRSDLGEHVDDHQITFARRMAAEGYIDLAEDEQTFRSLVEAASSGRLSQNVPPVGETAAEVVRRFEELINELTTKGRGPLRRTS
jgi:UDP-N-acetylglucosamine transferase subunit ALG13